MMSNPHFGVTLVDDHRSSLLREARLRRLRRRPLPPPGRSAAPRTSAATPAAEPAGLPEVLPA